MLRPGPCVARLLIGTGRGNRLDQSLVPRRFRVSATGKYYPIDGLVFLEKMDHREELMQIGAPKDIMRSKKRRRINRGCVTREETPHERKVQLFRVVRVKSGDPC